MSVNSNTPLSQRDLRNRVYFADGKVSPASDRPMHRPDNSVTSLSLAFKRAKQAAK